MTDRRILHPGGVPRSRMHDGGAATSFGAAVDRIVPRHELVGRPEADSRAGQLGGRPRRLPDDRGLDSRRVRERGHEARAAGADDAPTGEHGRPDRVPILDVDDARSRLTTRTHTRGVSEMRASTTAEVAARSVTMSGLMSSS